MLTLCHNKPYGKPSNFLSVCVKQEYTTYNIQRNIQHSLWENTPKLNYFTAKCTRVLKTVLNAFSHKTLARDSVLYLLSFCINENHLIMFICKLN